MKRSAVRYATLRCSANVKNVVATGRKTVGVSSSVEHMPRARCMDSVNKHERARAQHPTLSKASPNENFADVAAHLAVDDPAGQRLRYDVTCTGACE